MGAVVIMYVHPCTHAPPGYLFNREEAEILSEIGNLDSVKIAPSVELLTEDGGNLMELP